MNNVIECVNLSKTFQDGAHKVRVFDNLNLTVASGGTVGVVGASGSGKSTLLHLLGGLDKPSTGSVKVSDQDIGKLSEGALANLRNRSLGFVYQFHHLLPEFNALENVCMPLLISRCSKKQALEKAKEMIVQVGLENRMLHRIGEMSGGERQRIAIARALVCNPECVLADEPTGNLDQKTADYVFDLMLSLNQKFKTSFVIVTHNNLLASRLGRVLRLQDGLLTADNK